MQLLTGIFIAVLIATNTTIEDFNTRLFTTLMILSGYCFAMFGIYYM